MITAGSYRARLAETPEEIALAQALRGRAFGTDGPDKDAFDDLFSHVLIFDAGLGTGAEPLATLRYRLSSPGELAASYSAQFYDLSCLSPAGQVLEVGRFCMDPRRADGQALRMAMGAMTQIVLARDVSLMFGCSSFAGADPARHGAGFSALAAGHLGPEALMPQPGCESVSVQSDSAPDETTLPALLRGYLSMGGWVSRRAVVDSALDTVHVFTAVEVDKIPPQRARLLTALAASLTGSLDAD